MASRRQVLVVMAAGLTAAAIGATVAYRRLPHGSGGTPFEVSFADLTGKIRTLDDWRGKTLIVNFWATWCAPCREEMPALSNVRERLVSSGVECVGIALDSADKVTEFLKTLPALRYPILIGDGPALALMKTLGNKGGGLPFTVVINREGRVAYTSLGPVTEQGLEAQVRTLIKA